MLVVESGSVEPQGFFAADSQRPVYIGYMRGLSPSDAAIDWWRTQMVVYCLERGVRLARIYHDWSNGEPGAPSCPGLMAAVHHAGEPTTQGVILADTTFPITPAPTLAILAEVFHKVQTPVRVFIQEPADNPELGQGEPC